jgi:hypothetical protein
MRASTWSLRLETADPSKFELERSLVLAKLADLHRVEEQAVRENRPALVHACQLLIGLQAGALRELELRTSGAT